MCTVENKFVSYREQFVSYINSDYLRLCVEIFIESLLEYTEIHCGRKAEIFNVTENVI